MPPTATRRESQCDYNPAYDVGWSQQNHTLESQRILCLHAKAMLGSREILVITRFGQIHIGITTEITHWNHKEFANAYGRSLPTCKKSQRIPHARDRFSKSHRITDSNHKAFTHNFPTSFSVLERILVIPSGSIKHELLKTIGPANQPNGTPQGIFTH